MNKIFSWCVGRHPKIFLSIFFVLTILISWQMKFLKTELSVYNVLDKKFQSTLDMKIMREQFGDSYSIQIIFKNNHSLSQKYFCQINHRILKISRQFPGIVKITTPLDYREVIWNREAISYPPILKVNCDSDSPLNLDNLKKSAFGFFLVGKNSSLAYEFEMQNSEENINDDFDPTPIGHFFDKIRNEFKNDDLTIHFGGKSAILWHIHEMFKNDSMNNIYIMIFILFLFKLLFGSFKAGPIFLFTLIITISVSYGLMSVLNIPLDLITNGLFMIVLVATVEDFIFLSQHMMVHKTNIFESFQELFEPSFMTSFTTTIGFGSLMISDLIQVRRFGMIGALASIIEWIIIFLVLPAMLKIFSLDHFKWTSTDSNLLSKLIKKISSFHLSKKQSYICMGIGLFSFLFITTINFNDLPQKKFSSHHLHQKYSDYLDENFNHQGIIFLLIPRESSVNNQSKINEDTTLQAIASHSNVSHIFSPHYILNSYTSSMSPSIKNLVENDFIYTSFYSKFYSLEYSRVIIYLKSIEQKKVEETISWIRHQCKKECSPVGEIVTLTELSSKVSQTLFEGLGLSLIIVISIILFLCYKFHIESKWKIILAILWCPGMLIGSLSLLQIPINLVTSIVGSVFIGLAGDNIIQYIYSKKNQDSNFIGGIHEKAAASIKFSLTCIFSCCFFFNFTLIPLREMGLMLMLGFIFLTIGDFYLLKSFFTEEK